MTCRSPRSSDVPGAAAAHRCRHEGLERSKGFIRSTLANRMTIRKAPQLIFIYDESLEKGNRSNGSSKRCIKIIKRDFGRREPSIEISFCLDHKWCELCSDPSRQPHADRVISF
ncbi:MAG: ribosome-binding factor A [Merdibacter sp.]